MSFHLQEWLTEQNSLTEKLKSFHQPVTLKILNESWRPIVSTELIHSSPMQIYLNQHSFVREILICVKNDIAWYAKTIIPKTTYKANVTQFERLQHESLGQIVFNNPEILRTSLDNNHIQQDNPLCQWLNPTWFDDSCILGLRTSIFMEKAGHPFWLFEIILPGLGRIID